MCIRDSCNSSSRTNPSTLSNPACVFNDITKGTISVACTGGSPNCSNTSTAANSFGILTTATGGKIPAFNTTAGYDLATGLGSVDVTNLTNAWTTAAGNFKASATTLSINGSSSAPVSITHGQSVSLSFTVKPVSGTVNPTGDVALLTSSNVNNPTLSANLGILSFPLTNGVACGTPCPTNLLPGGTYTVSAHYAGDGTFGPSDSTPPISVTVTREGSQTTIALVAFAANGTQSVQTSVPYGSPYILKVGVTNGSTTQCSPNGSTVPTPLPCPTGKVTLTDNNAALNDFNGTDSANLNNQGILEDQPVQLLPGSHALVATYAGDNSFLGSTSPTDTVTVTKAATTTTVTASPTSITSGSMVTLTATVATQSSGVAPGGALTAPVQFLNGTTPISGTVNLTRVNGPASSASLTATLTTTLSALGIPDITSPWRPKLPPGLFWLLGFCALLYGLFLVKMPWAKRSGYAYAGLAVFALAAAGIAGCGGGGSSKTPQTKTVTITAKFVGDSNYTASSGTTTVTVQ